MINSEATTSSRVYIRTTTRTLAATAIALPKARVIGQSNVISLALASSWKRVLILLFLVLASAIGFVYSKDLNRQLFSTGVDLQKTFTQLQTENNSLVLESSAWANQARVQQLAEKQFNMELPQANSIVLLKVT
jgi:cell division protein FtsL